MIISQRERVDTPIEAGFRDAATNLPIWCAPSPRTTLADWPQDFAAPTLEVLREAGGVILRGFAPLDKTGFNAIVLRLTGPTTLYGERTTPRRHLGEDIYTSTDYPADQEIFLHNENSYASCWPAYLYFYCAHAATSGGDTTVADVLRVEAAIAPEIWRRLIERGLLHRCTFIEALGIPWQVAFGTPTEEDLRAFCAKARYRIRQFDKGRLVLDYPHSPVVRMPASGQRRWFNHAAFFQPEGLDRQTMNALETLYGADCLPNRIVYGDGTPIEVDVVARLRAAYAQASRPHAWQDRDLMILDNMRFAHGRQPFRGERTVWVAMSGQFMRKDLAM